MLPKHKLQDVVHAVRTANVSSSDVDVLRRGIYDIAMHAFTSEVLTLGRMRSVITAVRVGVADSAQSRSAMVDASLELAQQGAYQGLCTAALEGLTSAGLAYTEFLKFNYLNVADDFDQLLLHETLALKQQIDQVTLCADWLSNSNVVRLQLRGFSRLLQPEVSAIKQETESVLPWTDRFFQASGYAVARGKSNAQASLLLLGLLTSGVLSGLRGAQAAA
jgi:hypothetical protein